MLTSEAALFSSVARETQGPENTYSFDMNALNAHLRKQHDANPHASFFNIDILKYRVSSRS